MPPAFDFRFSRFRHDSRLGLQVFAKAIAAAFDARLPPCRFFAITAFDTTP